MEVNKEVKTQAKNLTKNTKYGKNRPGMVRTALPSETVKPGVIEVPTTPMADPSAIIEDNLGVLQEQNQIIDSLLLASEPKAFFEQFRPLNLVEEITSGARVVLDSTPKLEHAQDSDTLDFTFKTLRERYARGLNWYFEGKESLYLYSPQTMMLGGQVESVPFRAKYLEHASRPILDSYGSPAPDPNSVIAGTQDLLLPFWSTFDKHMMNTKSRGNRVMSIQLDDARTTLNFTIDGTENYLMKDFTTRLAVTGMQASRLHTKIIWRLFNSFPIKLSYNEGGALKAFPGGLIANNRILGALGGGDLEVTQAAGIEFGDQLIHLLKLVTFNDVIPKIRLVEDPISLYTAWTPLYTVIAAAYTFQFIPDGIELVNKDVFIDSLRNFLSVQRTRTTVSVASLTALFTHVPANPAMPYVVASGRTANNYTDIDRIVKMDKFDVFARDLNADLASAQKGKANVNSMTGAPKNFLDALANLSQSSSPKGPTLLWLAKIIRNARSLFPKAGARSSRLSNFFIDISPHKAFGFASTFVVPSTTKLPKGLKNLKYIIAEHASYAVDFIGTFKRLYSSSDPFTSQQYRDTLISTSHSRLIDALKEFMAMIPAVKRNLYLNELILNQAREETYVDRLSVSFVFTPGLAPITTGYEVPTAEATLDTFTNTLTINDTTSSLTLRPVTDPAPAIHTLQTYSNTTRRPLAARFKVRGIFESLSKTSLADVYPEIAYPIRLHVLSLEEIIAYFKDNVYNSNTVLYKIPDADDRLASSWLSAPSLLFVVSTNLPEWARYTFHSSTTGAFARTNKFTVDYLPSTYDEIVL